MGAAARRLAERNFDARRNSAEILRLYRRLLNPAESQDRPEADGSKVQR
jgi:hypothetical protein